MNKFKSLLYLVMFSVFLSSFSSCSQPSGNKNAVASIDISVDKTILTANMREYVKISAAAKDKSGSVIKDAKIQYYVNEKIIPYPQFRTNTKGINNLYAKCGNVKSKNIRIIASEGSVDSVNLKADKINILNNGSDASVLTGTVLDQSGKSIAEKVNYLENDKYLKDNNFKTDKSGIFLLTARSGSVNSNILAISASPAVSYNIVLETDKNKIANNGTDAATLTCKVLDLKGQPVTGAIADLYDKGVKITGNILKSDKAGKHYIYAVYNGHVSNTLEISAEDPVPPLYTGEPSDMPVIVINTKGKNINEVNRITATMSVYDNGKMNKPSDKPALVSDISIKVRGQSSVTFVKKQYSVKTIGSDGTDNNVTLLGMPKEHDWILNGSYADKSLIRLYCGMEFFRPEVAYASRTRFCEVYVNDCNDPSNPYNYKGIYTLLEKIKVDDERVNIDKLSPQDNSGINVTGGYIVAQDKIKPGELSIMTSRSRFTYVYPDYDTLTPEQNQYIRKYVADYTSALFSKDFKDPEKGYAAYLDVDSYVTVLAINEFLKTIDGMNVSTYYYKPRGEKLHAGPPWDFDLSSGNTDCRTGTDPKGWYCVSLDIYPRQMMKDPAFVDLFRKKWQSLRKTTLSDSNIDKVMDTALGLISNAKERSFERWPGQWDGSFCWLNPMGDLYTSTHDAEVSYMRKFLHERAKWIDDNINKPIDLTPVHYDWIDERTGIRMNPPPSKK